MCFTELLLFTRKIYPEINPIPEREIINRLQNTIFTDTEDFDARTGVLLSLANNANILILGTRLTGEMHAKEILDVWLSTNPSDEPRRVNFHRGTDEIDDYYRKAKL